MSKAISSSRSKLISHEDHHLVPHSISLRRLLSRLDKSELVFVGYGITAPERGWNDYAGVDVRGKTVVILVNDPDWQTPGREGLFEGRATTWYGRWPYKFENAAKHGAAAALIIGLGALVSVWERDKVAALVDRAVTEGATVVRGGHASARIAAASSRINQPGSFRPVSRYSSRNSVPEIENAAAPAGTFSDSTNRSC